MEYITKPVLYNNKQPMMIDWKPLYKSSLVFALYMHFQLGLMICIQYTTLHFHMACSAYGKVLVVYSFNATFY